MTIRDHFHPEVGGLGRKVEVEVIKPQYDEEVAPGIWKDSEGRFYTVIVENEEVNIPLPLEHYPR
jgi:hypothetical protein